MSKEHRHDEGWIGGARGRHGRRDNCTYTHDGTHTDVHMHEMASSEVMSSRTSSPVCPHHRRNANRWFLTPSASGRSTPPTRWSARCRMVSGAAESACRSAASQLVSDCRSTPRAPSRPSVRSTPPAR